MWIRLIWNLLAEKTDCTFSKNFHQQNPRYKNILPFSLVEVEPKTIAIFTAEVEHKNAHCN